jgi:hypothetical protein
MRRGGEEGKRTRNAATAAPAAMVITDAIVYEMRRTLVVRWIGFDGR